MKRRLSIVIVACLILLPLWAHAQTGQDAGGTLESAYKSQYERYTSQIVELKKTMQTDQKIAEDYMALYQKSCKPFNPGLYRECKSILDSAMPPGERVKKNKSILAEVEEKKQDLRIRVLEKTNSLPTWWIE